MEVAARDGLQNEKMNVPTEVKKMLIDRLAQTGVTRMEATSFVSPKWVPQLADAKEIMQHVNAGQNPSRILFSVLTPNMKGLERAIAANAQEVALFAAASEKFSQKNTNCSIATSLQICRELTHKAREHGIKVRGYVSVAAGCPYEGPVKSSVVTKITSDLLDMGCYEVSIADTIGVATQASIRSLFSDILQSCPADRLAAHFHDTYGQAVANCIQALDMGIRNFDSSVGGLGGCPFAKGATGNVATEDVLYAFEGLGVKTGVDLEEMSRIGDWISRELGRKNASRAGNAIATKLRM